MANEEIKAVANATEAVAKLTDTVLKGIGTVGNQIFGFDRKKIERIGSATAMVEKKKILAKAEAEAQAEIIKFETKGELAERASQRLMAKEMQREANIEKTVLLAQEDLEDTTDSISKTPVDKDWAVRFFNIAQDINDEEMQILWAKILAGEIKNPNSFSLRTLELIKNLSSHDANLFQVAVSLSFDNSFIILPKDINNLEKYGLPYVNILDLRESQLVSTDNSEYKSLDVNNERELKPVLPAKTNNLELKIPKGKEFKVNVLNFTKAGWEIAKLIQVNTNNEYFEDVKKAMIEKGYEVIN